MALIHRRLFSIIVPLAAFLGAMIGRSQDAALVPSFPLELQITKVVGCRAYLEIRNIGRADVYWFNSFLGYRGPGMVQELVADIFDVRSDTGDLAYMGIRAEMDLPEVEDFKLLKSGEIYKFTVDLEKYYRIVPSTGYELRGRISTLWFYSPLRAESSEAASIGELSSEFIPFTCSLFGHHRGKLIAMVGLVTAVVFLALRKIRKGEQKV